MNDQYSLVYRLTSTCCINFLHTAHCVTPEPGKGICLATLNLKYIENTKFGRSLLIKCISPFFGVHARAEIYRSPWAT